MLGLYRECPPDGVVVCFDEMGPIQLIPHQGSGWAQRKRPERLRATYSKHGGVRYLFGAYDVHADRLHGRLRPHKSGQEILGFYRQIRMRYPGRIRIYLVADNLSAHKTPDIRTWAQNNNVELVFTPTYASFLNRIECHFWAIGEFVVNNADYPDWNTTSRRTDACALSAHRGCWPCLSESLSWHGSESGCTPAPARRARPGVTFWSRAASIHCSERVVEASANPVPSTKGLTSRTQLTGHPPAVFCHHRPRRDHRTDHWRHSWAGLAAAHAAAARGAHVLVAGRSPDAVRDVAAVVGGDPIVVDLERLADVHAVAEALPAVEAVALNAGLQVITGASRTPDGFETTFQVNHLAQLLLLDVLLARSEPPARVVLTGSGTHDPSRRTGMPAPLDGEVGTWARADDGDEAPGVAGRRRYTTSKLLNAATAAALTQERPDIHVTCFDPGLMLDTGLSRQYPAAVRRLTTLLAPTLAMVLPFASTAKVSGHALARLLLEVPPPAASGAYVDHRLRTTPASQRARDTGFQTGVLHDSRALLNGRANEVRKGGARRSGASETGRRG